MPGLAAALQSAEWAKGTHLISLGVTHVSAKPTAEEKNRRKETNLSEMERVTRG